MTASSLRKGSVWCFRRVCLSFLVLSKVDKRFIYKKGRRPSRCGIGCRVLLFGLSLPYLRAADNDSLRRSSWARLGFAFKLIFCEQQSHLFRLKQTSAV